MCVYKRERSLLWHGYILRDLIMQNTQRPMWRWVTWGSAGFYLFLPHIWATTEFFLLLFLKKIKLKYSFPGSSAGKESTCNAGKTGDCGFSPCVGKIPRRRKGQPTPVFLPEKSRGQRSLVGYSPKGCNIFGVYFHLALGFSADLTKYPAHLFIRDIF